MNTSKAYARHSDPVTSHDAAESVTESTLRGSRQAVLSMLRRAPHGATAEVLERVLPEYRPQRVRTALVELERLGIVARTSETGYTSSGRKAQIWKAVEQ